MEREVKPNYYKLLKDLPYAKAGEVFERVTHKSEDGLSDYDYLEIKKRVKDGEDEVNFGIKYNYFLNNFDDWFEEIPELTDSIHWKPVIGEEYWSFHSDGGISHNFCTGGYWDDARYKMGRTYRTEEECIRARDRELAEVVFTIRNIHKDYYKAIENGWSWSDQMLEPAEKNLDNLCAGDFIRRGDGLVRKVLVVINDCYMLACGEEYAAAGSWYTAAELYKLGYRFIGTDAPESTIEIDGKKYKKADVEKAIKDLEVVD
jgi:hypothetical protein